MYLSVIAEALSQSDHNRLAEVFYSNIKEIASYNHPFLFSACILWIGESKEKKRARSSRVCS